MTPNFVAKQMIDRRSCLMLNGKMVLEEFSVLRNELIAAATRDAAALFAEPVLTPSNGQIEIAWYAELVGEPKPLDTLDPDVRRFVVQKLRSRLEAIAPLLSSDFGDLLGRALYLDDSAHILALGKEPLLIGWGILPPGVAANDQSALDRHFAATLGRYAPFGARRIAPPFGPRPAGTGPVASAGRVRDGVAVAGEGRMGGRIENRALLIATGIAALCALLFSLPGVLATPAASLLPEDGALARAKAITKAMQDKIDQAKAALGTADCNPDGTIKAPTKDGQSQLPPPPIPIKQDLTRTQGDLSLVARRATESVVFIFTCTDRQAWEKTQKDTKDKATPIACPGQSESGVGDLVLIGWGSGFFIAPKLIATNTHVVEGAKAVFVTNSFLGRVAKAQVKAATVKENLRDADFAALSVDVENSPPAIELASTASRLQNVVAAGYPGLITEQDAQLRRLLTGDSAAAPELTTFPGFITVTMNEAGAVPMFYTSAVIGHGNSGGPLLDLCARAVGVNTLGGSGSGEESGYSINIAEGATALAAFLDQNHIDLKTVDTPCEPGPQASSAPPPTSPPGPLPSDPPAVAPAPAPLPPTSTGK